MVDSGNSVTSSDVNLSNGYASTCGGAIENEGTLDLMYGVLSGNHSGEYGGGIYNDDEFVRLSQSAVMFNHASSGGGGIYNYGPGTVGLFATNISFNTPDNCEPGGSVSGCSG